MVQEAPDRVMHCLYYYILHSFLSSARSASAIARKRCLMCLRIVFVYGKIYHCRWTFNQLCLRQWHFMIKSIWFQHSKLSKVAKMIYNSISDACLIVWPNLAIQSLEFDQNAVQTWQNNFTSSTMALTLLWFPAASRFAQSSKYGKSNSGKVQNDVFPIPIYKFNI